MHDISWAFRIVYLVIAVAFLSNLFMASRSKFKPHWRLEFGYTALVTGVYLIYVILRITDVLDARDFAEIVRWIYPCLAIPYILCPLLFYWEDKFHRLAVEAAQKDIETSDDI